MIIPPKILMESIDNLTQENSELRAMNAQLVDALKNLLADPKEDTNKKYSEYVLLKAERKIGRK